MLLFIEQCLNGLQLGLLLFLYNEVRRSPGPAQWGRVPRWPKRLRIVFAAIVLLIAGAVFDNLIYLHRYIDNIHHRPAIFWLWALPYNSAIMGSLVALFFATSKRANIVLLTISILLLAVPYWENRYIARLIARHYGYDFG